MTKRIVVVDDDHGILDVLSIFFRKKNLVVRTFSVPSEAFEYVSKNGVTLILVDHDMPSMKGPKFIENVRVKNPKIYFIGMSADERNEKNFHKVRANGFLKKPFNINVLSDILKFLGII